MTVLERAPSPDGTRDRAAAYLAARLARELHELDALVERAEERLRVDGEALDRTSAGIERQARAVETGRAAAEVLAPASASVATHAGELAALAERLPGVTSGSIDTLDTLAQRTAALRDAFDGESAVTTRIAAGWERVADAVRGIAATGARARVLAINAAIESAHAVDGGFSIVTGRMRALANATLSAAERVDAIVARATESLTTARDDVARAAQTMEAALTELRAARGRFEDATAHATAFGDGVARLATIAEEQAAAIPEIAGAVASLARLSAAIAERVREDPHGSIAQHLDGARRALARHRDTDAPADVAEPGDGGDPVAAYLIALADGRAAERPDDELAAAGTELAARVLDDERRIVGGICAAAEMTAHTGVFWRAFNRDVRAYDEQLAQLAT
ncbi:MAG TPA: methyl-accepting chemotaxis protein, partial [Candidatus Elarobacter sp.]